MRESGNKPRAGAVLMAAGERMAESDEALMVRVAAGDAEAFAEIVRRYEARARRFCYRIFRDTQDAEDAAQEVFLKLFRHADLYQPTGRFQTWFYRVLGNLCFDRLRFERRRAAVRAGTLDGFALDERHDASPRFAGPESAAMDAEQRAAVREAVHGLPERLRQALVLREFDGLKYREIAEVMGVSLSEVKVLIHRGRKTLARRLARMLAREGRP